MLLVAIVNYRTTELAIDSLRSLPDEVAALPGTRVVVVDNASGDDSVDRLTEAIRANGWESWAAVLPLDYNGGFAAGNNAAIPPALASVGRSSSVTDARMARRRRWVALID